MKKVRPWCGQPSDRGRLKNRIEVGEFDRALRMTGEQVINVKRR